MNMQKLLYLFIILICIGTIVSGAAAFSEARDVQSSSQTVRPVLSAIKINETRSVNENTILSGPASIWIQRDKPDPGSGPHEHASSIIAGSGIPVNKTGGGPGYLVTSESYRYLTKWGERAHLPDGLLGAAVDSGGNVYAISYYDSSVFKFNKSGGYVTSWSSWNSTSDFFSGIGGVAVDSGGNVYVADTGRVVKFNSTGGFLKIFGESHLLYPTGITIDSGGNSYVADIDNHSVVKFTSTGGFLTRFGMDHLVYPIGIAVGSGGNIYVSDITEACVYVFNATGGYLGQIGSYGTSKGEFQTPSGVAVGSEGSVYVSDSTMNCIQKFSPTGTYQGKWGTTGYGYGEFDEGVSVTTDKTGNVYVADFHNNRVQKFSSTGTYLSCFGEPGSSQLADPYGVALNSAGMIYIADADRNHIQKFTQAGKFVTAWGRRGSAPSQFNYPYGIATDPGSNVYVADSDNNRIQKFNSAGTYITGWGVQGFANGQLNVPIGIAVESGRNVYVVENGNKRVQKFSSNGEYITRWGTQGTGNGQFNCPTAIAVSANGNVYVTDDVNGNIQRFNSTGSYITSWTIAEPTGVTVDMYGDVYVSDAGTDTIQKYSPLGELIASWGSSGTGNGEFDYPCGITVDIDGYVYVADHGNARIQVFEKVPNLTVTAVTPNSSPNMGKTTVIIKGMDINKGVTATLTNSTISIPGSVSYQNKTSISCTFTLTGAPTRSYNCTLRNPDGQVSTLPGAFTVTNFTPSITSITPASGYNSSSTPVTISGTSFRSGVTTSLTRGSTTLAGTITSRTSSKILCTFPLSGVPTGLYNLTVRNSDGSSAMKMNAFTVQQSGTFPTISSLSPTSGTNTGASPFIINGTNFRAGATVIITNGTTNKTVAGSVTGSTRISCSLPLTGLPAGLYNVTIRNTDGSFVIRQDAFTVNNPAPLITTISPSSGYTTGSSVITIPGSRFMEGAAISLVNGSSLIPGSITSFTPTKIVGLFVLTGFPPGMYNLTVTNPGGLTGTRPFTLIAPGDTPTIGSISPASGTNTATLALTINGTNFRSGATVTITNGTRNLTVAGILTSSTKMRCSLPLAGLPAGLYNLTILNGDGSSASQQNIFTVNNPAPVITSISPSSGYSGDTPVITITGSKFAAGARISLVNGSTLVPGSVTSLTETRIVCTVLLTGVTPGLYNLTVSNQGAPDATKPFTVLSPGGDPVISSFNPTSGTNTAALPFTVNGSNFRTRATVTITNGSVNKTVIVASLTATRITCSLPLTGLSNGLYNLTVRNTDGSSVTRQDAFTVNCPIPSITRITPVSGYNSSIVQVTITGTKFSPGAAIMLLNGSTTITGMVSSLSATNIAGSFPLSGARAGIYNLSVSNPGDVNTTKLNAFTVLAPGTLPVISTLNPASGFNNANLPVTITGSNFRTPTVYLNQGSLLKLARPTSGKTQTSATLYVTLPLTGIPGGMYNITVCNSDGVSVTAQNIFYVTDQAWISSPKTVTRSPVVLRSELPMMGRPATTLVMPGPSGRRVI